MFKPGFSKLFVSSAFVLTLLFITAPTGSAEGKPTPSKSVQSKNDSSKYKTLKLEITEKSPDRYLLEATLIWKKIPSMRGKDIMSISFENDGKDYAFIKPTIKAQQTYSAYGHPKVKKETFQYTLSDEPAKFIVTRTGIAIIQDLKDNLETWDNYLYVYEIKQTIQCELIVEKENNTKFLTSSAGYLHRVTDESSLPISSVSLKEESTPYVSINSQQEKYDNGYYTYGQLEREDEK